MATGALDANGIWQFGEDDPLSPYSTFMNKGQGPTSTQIGLLRSMPWTTYAPTLTGFVLGTGGTSLCVWRKEGDLVRVWFRFTFGTSGQTFPTQPRFTLPVTSLALRHPFEVVGLASMYSGAGAIWQAVVTLVNTTTAQINYSTGGALADPSPTAPFTWVSTGAMAGELTYRS